MSSFRSGSIGRISRLPQPKTSTSRSKSCAGREPISIRPLVRTNSNLGSQELRPSGSSAVRSTFKSTTFKPLVRTKSNLESGGSTTKGITSTRLFPRTSSNLDSESRLSKCKKTPLSIKPRSQTSGSLRTPLQHFRGRSPTSLKKSQHGSQAFGRIKKYFLEKDPTITELKPPTIANFITTMNILFHDLDPSIKFNKTNYQEDVPNKLIQLGYAGKISAKFMRTVNSSIAFQQVLDMWIFLLDIVEEVPVLASVSEDDLLLFNHVTKFIAHISHSKANIDDFTQEYEEELYKMMNVDPNQVREREEELRQCISLNEELVKKEDILEKKLQDLEETVETAEYLDERIQIRKNELQAIVTKISTQKYTLREYNELKDEKNFQESIFQLRKEKQVYLQNLIDEAHAKINEYRKEFLKRIYNINNKVYGYTRLMPEYEECNLRVTGFANPEFLIELKEAQSKYLELNKILKTKVVNQAEILKEYNEQIKELEKEMEHLKIKHAQEAMHRQKLAEELSTLQETKVLSKLRHVLCCEEDKLGVLMKEVEGSQAKTAKLDHYSRLGIERLEKANAHKIILTEQIDEFMYKFHMDINKFMLKCLDISGELKDAYIRRKEDKANRAMKLNEELQENMKFFEQVIKCHENNRLLK